MYYNVFFLIQKVSYLFGRTLTNIPLVCVYRYTVPVNLGYGIMQIMCSRRLTCTSTQSDEDLKTLLVQPNSTQSRLNIERYPEAHGATPENLDLCC